MISLTIIETEPTDSSAVSETLLQARGALSRAEPREALRLLRQAAEAAETAGDDVRALALARAAADLANEVGASVPPPPSYEPPTAPTPAAAEPSLEALLASGRAVRVLVKRSARDEELYVVRRPVDGKPAFDAREAVIVLVEPDPEFFARH